MTHLKKGDLIIADPSIVNDIQFNRSIILITSSSIENEVVGLIINKILDYKLKDIIPEINIDFDVYDGGPVNKDNLYYIHNLGHLIPKSIKINQQLFWSGDFDTIVDLINSKKITTKDIKFCLGYTGWSAKQLINEVRDDNWIKCTNIKSEDILTRMSNSWKKTMINLGGEYTIWSNAPENLSHN
ncbi:YqgE/AlgH family protein [Flavobacteriaceae bacterium]|nr:YqgE/AlgH family protein [Flavobacteriaceae bacterium]MDB4196223.1 YqgE/AlgH family protein [Flavobacteriaceae bacterium]